MKKQVCENKNIRISVITVCKNAEKVIKKTIDSVLEQTYCDIEYLIIEGNSTDKTIEYIREYSLHSNIKYISENDKGIYDAMNKGINRATGDYLYFLNAGDSLRDKSVISDVVEFITHNQADIYYGDIIYKYPNGDKKIRTYGKICGTRIYYCTGDSINHQSVFASKECFKEDVFDTSYKICADREWMMRMHKKGYRYKALHKIIAEYSLDEGSVSIANKQTYKDEADACIRKHFKIGYPVFWCLEAIRNNKILGKGLHMIYKVLFIRNGE